MSEQSQKSRFAIDLDDLERQLRDMQANETRQPAADPLAELARLVGQDDPLKNVFGVGQPERSSSPPQFDVPAEDLRGSVDEFDAIFDRHASPQDHTASRPDEMLDDELAREVLAAIAPEARAQAGYSTSAPLPHSGDTSTDPFADFGELVARDLDRNDAVEQPDTPSSHQTVHDFPAATSPDPSHGPLAADAAIMGAVAAAAAGAAAARSPGPAGAYDETDPVDEAPRRSLSKGAITAIALVGVGVVGIGGAAIWRGGKSSDGEPRIIKAEPGPSRVQPQNPGGTEVPDQNKQIYERAGAPKPADTKVVNRDEQPVDVQAAVRNQTRPGSPPIPSAGTVAEATPPAAAASSPAAGLGEPRRVRTIAIRPDGSVISAPPAANAQSGNLTTSSAPSPAAPQGVTPQSPAAQIATPASTPPQTIVRQQAPRPATPAATPPAAVPSSEEAPRTAAPAPQQRPQPQRVAAAPAADAPAAAGGGFVVQLAAPGSENEARSVFSSLQRRFPDELGGQRPQIRKAEVNGREVFRLRVGPMSRESATDLCTRLKGRGGQCFVAGN